MKIALMTALTLALPLTQVIAQETYQTELNLLHANNQQEQGDLKELSTFVSYYFDDVSLAKGPYAEADFIQRTDRLTAAIGYSSFNTSEEEYTERPSGPHYMLQYLSTFGGSSMVASVGYSKISRDGTYSNSGETIEQRVTSHEYAASIGSYLGERTGIALSLSQEKQENDVKNRSRRITHKSTERTRSLALQFKHIANLEDGRYLRIEPTVTQAKRGDTEAVTADLELGYFFNKSAQILSSAGRNFETDLTSASLGFEYFVTPLSAFTVDYLDAAINDSDAEDTSLILGVTTRF